MIFDNYVIVEGRTLVSDDKNASGVSIARAFFQRYLVKVGKLSASYFLIQLACDTVYM